MNLPAIAQALRELTEELKMDNDRRSAMEVAEVEYDGGGAEPDWRQDVYDRELAVLSARAMQDASKVVDMLDAIEPALLASAIAQCIRAEQIGVAHIALRAVFLPHAERQVEDEARRIADEQF